MQPADNKGPIFKNKLKKKKKQETQIHNKSTLSSINLLFHHVRGKKEALQTLGANNWVFDLVYYVVALLLLG